MLEVVQDVNSDYSEMSQEQLWLLDTSASRGGNVSRGQNVCGQDDDSFSWELHSACLSHHQEVN